MMNNLRTTFLLLLATSALCTATAQTSGKASYYANYFQGRRMSNGQPYDKNKMTCAHRSLPFGTKLRVRNQANGREVIVEVTDRGPFSRGRLIDLSYAAAKELGTVNSGVGYVQIEVLSGDVMPPYPLLTSNYDGPEMEFGMAGLCYEFIPKWKEEKPAEEEAATAGEERETKDKEAAKTEHGTGYTARPQAGPAQKKAVRTADSNVPAAKRKDESATNKEKGSSKKWTDFFNNLFSW